MTIIIHNKGRPAVDLDISGESHVRKIHFYKKGA